MVVTEVVVGESVEITGGNRPESIASVTDVSLLPITLSRGVFHYAHALTEVHLVREDVHISQVYCDAVRISGLEVTR